MAESITVVMCTYNGEKFLREQLDSILQQSYPIHEFLIQDDRSQDGTLSILREYQERYPFIQVQTNEKNLGFNANFRTAICRATGDFISIADQDDTWHPDKLKEMVHSIGNKAMCYSFSSTSNGQTIEDIEKNLNNNDTLERLLMSNCIPGHSMLLRRSFVQQIPYWNDTLLYDWWIAVNAHFHGGVQRCNRILTYHRIHQESAMSRYHRQNKEKQLPYLPYLKGYPRYQALKKKDSWQKFYRYIYEKSSGTKALATAHHITGAMLGKGLPAFLHLCFLCMKHRRNIATHKDIHPLRAFFYPCFYAYKNKCFDNKPHE